MLRYFMLSNGYELIGEVADGEQYDVRKLLHPWRLLLTSRGYVPVPSPAGEIVLDNSHVLLEGSVDDELANVYRQQNGAIVRPPAGVVFTGNGFSNG